MAARFDFTFLGDKALQAQLAGLTDKLERKILTQGIARATKAILLPAVVANTPVGSPYTRVTRGRLITGGAGAFRRIRFRQEAGGRLRRSLKVRQLPRRKGRVGSAVVTGTRAELGLRGARAHGRGYYPAHLEFGFTTRGHGRRITTRQRYIKRPFLAQRTAWLEAVAQEMRAGLEREVHP